MSGVRDGGLKLERLRLSDMPLWMSVSSIAVVVTSVLFVMLTVCDVLGWQELEQAIAIAFGLSAAFVVIWAFFVLPFLWSAVPAATDGVPMWRKRVYTAFLLWTPVVLITMIPGIQGLDAIIDWLRGARLDTRGWIDPWWPPAIALTLGYAWFSAKFVDGRLRIAAAERQVCFRCGYSLAEIPNCTRCPECGTAVESPVGSTPPGDAADATARD